MSTIKNPIKIIPLFSLSISKKNAFVILFLSLVNYSYCTQTTTAVKGVLNLRNRSWAKDGLADLNGEWEFYWNALYTPSDFDAAVVKPIVYATVPGFWNNLVPGKGFLKPAFGYATYRLKVLCPPSSEQLSLKFLTVASAYKLFVNGKQVAVIGKVGTSPATTTPAFQPAIVPVTPLNNELDIVIQVANFTYDSGGLWDFIKLGTAENVNNYHTKNVAQDFFVAGSFFLMSIFYFVIYFFFKRTKSPLYFALFCLLIGIRPLVTDELGINYITHWSWQFVKHIEFTSLYLTVPILSLFSFELFPKEFSKKMLRWMLLVSVPFVVIALFTSPFIFRYTIKLFQLLMLLTAAYGLYVYIYAVKNKRIGAIYFLVGFVMLFITIVNDILYNSLLIKSTNLLYSGLYILVLCQATTLSQKFFRAYTKIETLNFKLKQVNDELNEKNEVINEANEQLSELNAELDTLVFRTSHDLRSPITSMFAMVDMIKMETDAVTRNEYIDFLRRTILRLDKIITEILQYAKNRSTALQYEQLDLKECISNALQDHLFSYDSGTIRRIVEVSQCGVFETDKLRFNMIISNLISNALKHHNKEQEKPYLKIMVHATEKQATIEVADNGHGIAEDNLQNIFTKFYRVNTKSTGSGFGLYIVKEMVEKLGGSISVESQLNVGTSFHIILPNGPHK